ncbi:MAG TPA: hypothetical protein PLG56_12390, partial [Lacunisphaera sp.]|nr:hypothetical protein [Lacunisphaera sp.]
TWKIIPGLPADKALYNVAFDARDPQRLALASWSHGLLVSEDGGATWTARNAGLPGEGIPRAWRTAIDPDNGEIYAAIFGQGLYTSGDAGRTWRAVPAMEGASVQTFTFVPSSQP